MTYKDFLFVTVSALLILGAFAKSTCKESSEESSEDEDEGYVDWTCEQCKDGAIGIGNYYVQRAQIAQQAKHLLKKTDVCETHPDPKACKAAWPEFWSSMGPLVWRIHYSYICDDLKECGDVVEIEDGNHIMSDSQSRPSCAACFYRVDGALDYLAHNETISEWTKDLDSWYTCGEEFDSAEDCKTYITGEMAMVFEELVDWKKGRLARDWCVHWGSCTKDEAEDLD